MGVPTVVVTTDQFRRLTDQVATSLSRPDLRIVQSFHHEFSAAAHMRAVRHTLSQLATAPNPERKAS